MAHQYLGTGAAGAVAQGSRLKLVSDVYFKGSTNPVPRSGAAEVIGVRDRNWLS
jgi:hypothetical protein